MISEQEIRRQAATELARDLSAGTVLDQAEWILRWLDTTGAEPVDMQRFVRSVIARARRAAVGCSGYGPDDGRP